MNNLIQTETWRGLRCFLWAGALQLTGAYFLWSTMRGNRPILIVILGSAMVIAATLVTGLQHAGFGRAYAGYGSIIALMALLWGWHYAGSKPDILDIVGSVMMLGSVTIIVLAPRT